MAFYTELSHHSGRDVFSHIYIAQIDLSDGPSPDKISWFGALLIESVYKGYGFGGFEILKVWHEFYSLWRLGAKILFSVRMELMMRFEVN